MKNGLLILTALLAVSPLAKAGNIGANKVIIDSAYYNLPNRFNIDSETGKETPAAAPTSKDVESSLTGTVEFNVIHDIDRDTPILQLMQNGMVVSNVKEIQDGKATFTKQGPSSIDIAYNIRLVSTDEGKTLKNLLESNTAFQLRHVAPFGMESEAFWQIKFDGQKNFRPLVVGLLEYSSKH